MRFGSSSRSKRRKSEQPHPHQRTQNAPIATSQYAVQKTPSPYAVQSRAYSVNVFHAPSHPTNIAAVSTVHLPHQPAPDSQPLHSTGVTPTPPHNTWCPHSKRPLDFSKWASYTNLNQSVSNVVCSVKSQTVGKASATILELNQLVRQSVSIDANTQDVTSRLLDQVITSIDKGFFCGKENELFEACLLPFEKKKDHQSHRTRRSKPSASADYFSKVYLYANSRLPPYLPPMKFYPPAYPLLRLASQYSRNVYDQPAGRERHSFVDADWRHGTKAMVIKSLPVDDMNTIVFAIRGTQNFLDWAVNVYTAPSSPIGFLDDPSNYCHAGFLSVARKMVAPVAARLRTLLEEDPNRMSYSLLITGHSAGGAVASLLFLHLLSEASNVRSELTHLRGCFGRIHCITFGAPPISLRPLLHPDTPSYPKAKSVFYSFINEGDPVARADKAYFFSLLDLYASPAPGSFTCHANHTTPPRSVHWRVPNASLSNAGRLILLRARGSLSGRPMNAPALHNGPVLPPEDHVEACITTDAELRGVVFGDPLMHLMDLYARRVDALSRSAPGKK